MSDPDIRVQVASQRLHQAHIVPLGGQQQGQCAAAGIAHQLQPAYAVVLFQLIAGDADDSVLSVLKSVWEQEIAIRSGHP